MKNLLYGIIMLGMISMYGIGELAQDLHEQEKKIIDQTSILYIHGMKQLASIQNLYSQMDCTNDHEIDENIKRALQSKKEYWSSFQVSNDFNSFIAQLEQSVEDSKWIRHNSAYLTLSGL